MPFPSAPMGQVLDFAAANTYPLVVDGGLTVRFGPNGLVRVAAQEAVNEGEEEKTVSLRIIMPQGMDLLPPVPAVPPERADGTWSMDVSFLIIILDNKISILITFNCSKLGSSLESLLRFSSEKRLQ